MRVAFGPHGVGAEVGHYLLLLVSYNYNINTGIRRKGFVNFGMPYYDKIDKIQLRMMQLFGIDIFPTHTNQLLFDPIKDFVAVGVGPLNYDDKYVTKGKPHKELEGKHDLWFLADRMGLVGPPLHIAHPKEKRIFNDFMADNPNPTGKSWEDLSNLFLQKSDYKDMFPKLPSMVRNYYNKWKLTQDLVSTQDLITVDYYGLLKRFAGVGIDPEATPVAHPAADFQSQTSNNHRQQELSEEDNTATVVATLPDNASENPIPVAPMAAPGQTQHVVSGNKSSDGRKKESKRCSGAPFGCSRLAFECSKNKNWKHCKSIREQRIEIPTTEEEQNKVIERYKQQMSAEKQARYRLKKKAEKANRAARNIPTNNNN